MDKQQLVDLTADIVAAHVSNNTVAISDVSTLILRVHESLSALDTPPAQEQQGKTPVVSMRASVKPDYLVCMECGTKQKMLKRHLATAHGSTPDQYRTDFGLPRDYPMVAANYSERRRTLAHAIGLGRKKGSKAAPKAAPKAAAKAVASAPAQKAAPKRRGRKKAQSAT